MTPSELSYEELAIIQHGLACLEKYGLDPYRPDYDNEIKKLKKLASRIDTAIFVLDDERED